MVLSRLKPARRSSGALATSRRYSRWGCFFLWWWRLSGTRSFCHEVVAVKVQHRPAAAPRTLPPDAIAGAGDPRIMVPVRLAGAEVTEAFWAKLAVLSSLCM